MSFVQPSALETVLLLVRAAGDPSSFVGCIQARRQHPVLKAGLNRTAGSAEDLGDSTCSASVHSKRGRRMMAVAHYILAEGQVDWPYAATRCVEEG